MKDLLVESTVNCPSCWEPHTVIIDLTAEDRSWIEDCHVCCNPMQVSFATDRDDMPVNVTAESA